MNYFNHNECFYGVTSFNHKDHLKIQNLARISPVILQKFSKFLALLIQFSFTS